MLPQSLALSREEAGQIEMFIHCPPSGRETRAVFCDGPPGVFDEHGRLSQTNALARLFPKPAPAAVCVRRPLGAQPLVQTTERPADITHYALDRLKPTPNPDWVTWAEQAAQLPRSVTLPPEARTRIHRYHLGAARLLAFERNVDYQMSESLKQANGNENLETPTPLEAKLAQPAHVYDLRNQKYLGRTDRIRFTLDPWQPALFALLPEQVAPETLHNHLLRGLQR